MLRAGADKVSINTAAVDNPDLLSEAAARFGVVHDRAEQRFLDLAHDQLVEVAGCMAVQAFKIAVKHDFTFKMSEIFPGMIQRFIQVDPGRQHTALIYKGPVAAR